MDGLACGGQAQKLMHSFTLFIKYFPRVIEIFNRFNTAFTFIYAWINLTLKATGNGFYCI